MSWEEFKKKKKQEEEKESSITNDNNSELSSWEKYKREVESENMSSWKKFKAEKENDSKRSVATNEEDTWFKSSSAFKDGYQFGDITGTTLATVGDIGVNLVKGAGGLVEGAGDLLTYGAADIAGFFGNESTAERWRKNAQKDTIDELFQPTTDYLDKYSVLGEKSDSITEGLGYVAGITVVSILTAGTAGALGASTTGAATAATIGSTSATFISGMGNGMTEALNSGADINEARIYGAISGAGEAVSELAFGGLGKASKAMGLSTGALDDVVVGGLTKNIKNKMVKTLVQSGLKASGEGLEEVVSGLISAAGKKFTYMNKKEFLKIVKDENLAEQFWMGALTSAIAQGPSTLRSMKTGTDYISRKTENEQKVYDSEVKTRTDAKTREITIEQAYNKQIKAKQNLGIEITEDVKTATMQKVENAYNNGTLKSTELNKKDLIKIQEEVEIDMQEGNISSESIMNTLGENQDISKDNLLMKSMYENEQKYNSYQVENTNNEKVNILMQSAKDSGMNNTNKTRKKVELISKLVKDTDRQYKFVSREQLKEMGYNENANGLINKSTGEILINARSDKGIQAIVGHETTHIFDSKIKGKGKHAMAEYSKEYQTLQDCAIEYAKIKGIYDSKIQSITSIYGDLLVDESQIKEELTADLVGDFLFNDEKFIENLAVKDKNVFQKIYDYIKHAYKMVRGTEEEKAFEKMKSQFEKVYKTISTETNNDTKYSIAGEKGMKDAIKSDASYLKLERNYNNAQKMQKIGIDNESIRQVTGWFQDKNGDWKFEFSDKDMSLKNVRLNKNRSYKLQDILKHDTLFTVYPELKKIEIQFKDLNKTSGNYNQKNNYIILNNKLIGNKPKIEGTLIHEIQHAIQSIEGFEGGITSKLSKKIYYESLGEIEAADTKRRFIDEKYKNKNISNIVPESSKANPKHKNYDNYIKNRGLLDKVKDSVFKYFKGLGENDEVIQENLEQANEETLRDNNEKVWNRLKDDIEESENNSGSFSFDENAKRYEDLLISNAINYNKRPNGMLNIEIFNDNELINQITVNSKGESVKQLGSSLGNYIYENAREESQVLDLIQQKGEKNKPVTHKEKQLEIIKKTNPMLDDYHTGIRNVEDIKTFKEVMEDEESFAWGDFSKEDAKKALKDGKVKIFSSYPIKNGVFVSTSYIQAQEYAGGKGNKVYSKTIPLDEVAWINGDEGQYANINQKYSLTDDIQLTGDDIAVKDMRIKEKDKNTIDEYVGSNTNSSIIDKPKPSKEIKDVTDKYKLMEIGKREYEKLLRREKPTEKEKITVDRLLKGEIENDEIPASVNRQRVVDLYNAKVKFYNVEKEIKNRRKEIVNNYRNLAKSMTKNLFTWKDKKRGIQYQINTMKRNLRDIIPDKSEADTLYNEYFKPITKNNANIKKEINKYNERISKYKINNIESQYIQMIGENKYNPDTKLPIEKIEEFYNKNKSKIDINKCNEAVEEFRKIYDELIIQINDTLIENGYKPIEYRRGYFPHFTEEKAETILGKFAEKLGWKINKDTLPTDIAGITEQFKPGKRWTSFSQQRKGDATDYNALKGFDNYIRGAMDVIYHTTDIQKLRALENEIRYQYSDKGIQEQIDNIYDDHELTIEEKEQKINSILDNAQNNPMGNLATEIRNYTNNLANKKETADRGMEQAWGRQTYSIMTNIQNRVSANMVGANISSAMTNFIPITQAWSQTSTRNMMKAIRESVASQFNDDGFSDYSVFLTNRTKQADRLYKTGLDKANDKLGYMFDIIDTFTSNVIVRAKYYDNIESGMNTFEAMENADEFAKDVIAGRSKGDMPTIFNKKSPLSKLFTAFQLEVNNQYGYMLKDMPADLGGEAKEKLVGAFVKMFLGAFLYNMLSEKITGRKSAFSPIDIALDSYGTLTSDEMSTGDKINSIGTDLVGEMPFIGGIVGGGRLPIQGAIPYDDPVSMFSETISNASAFVDGDEIKKETAIKSLTKEWSKPLFYVALPFAGGQLKKTIEGTSMYLNDVPGSYTNSSDLRFTVDDDIGSKVKSAIFGAYANPYAQDYIESGFKTVKKDNIEEMVGLEMNSTEYREYKRNLNKSNTTEEKLKYINSLDLTDAQKTLAANNLNKNLDKTINMAEYGNYSSYEEYKYARDYPKKYSVISQISSFDNYTIYKNAISDIKEEYSTEAGYTAAERKQVIQSYINTLDLNIYQKMMLEKIAGGYSINNYQNYIYEYLETLDLTDSEKYTIWEEVFN